MPLYEYQCDACGARFELIRKFSDPPLETCTACGKGPVNKLVSSPAFQFKGSGWYITDYARKSGGGGGDEKPSAPESGTDKSAGTSKETKKDAPAEKPAAASSSSSSSTSTPASTTKDS